MTKLQDDFVARAKRHVSYPVRSFDQIAWKLGCDRTTLSYRFKDEVGVTLSDYRAQKTGGVKTLKIERVKRFLRQTDLPIQEIAHRVGYSDVGPLNCTFKSQVGETPQKYREQYRKPPIPNDVIEAARMLVETDRSIEQISDELGYHDRSGVTKKFEHYYGLSCVVYRREKWGSRFFPPTVEKAKNLLANTDLTLEVVSQRVGFKSSRQLNHMMREIEGVTPNEYRIRARAIAVEKAAGMDFLIP